MSVHTGVNVRRHAYTCVLLRACAEVRRCTGCTCGCEHVHMCAYMTAHVSVDVLRFIVTMNVFVESHDYNENDGMK